MISSLSTPSVGKKLVICGGGSSAHTLIPLLNGSIFEVSILTSKPDRWGTTIELQYQEPSGEVLEVFRGNLHRASSRPEDLVPGADYIVLCMPVSQYRAALHNLAPSLRSDKPVFIGTIYGQGGFNWMVDEIKTKFHLTNIVTFAFGLIPWICRIIEYGKIGVTYGSKAVNVAAVHPGSYFRQADEELFDPLCHRWFHQGQTIQADNFLSLSLSVDNQIIHPTRCYALFKTHGRTWSRIEDVPMFYRDYDRPSADKLMDLDNDYTKIRERIKALYPHKDFRTMLDYLALERLSYASGNTDIIESFVNSKTLVAIPTPVVRNRDGRWEIDQSHRFFMDDIYYGLCIAKWMAEKLDIRVDTITDILRWAQETRGERIVDEAGRLITDSPDLTGDFKAGIPSFYGYGSIDDIVD